MHIKRYKNDFERLYEVANILSYDLHRKYRCESYIQVNYIVKDEMEESNLLKQIYSVIKKYSPSIKIAELRLPENGSFTVVAFNMHTPPTLQSKQEDICSDIIHTIENQNENYRVAVKSILTRLAYIKKI